MEFINVKDRLPGDNEEYLVWPPPDQTNHILTAEYQPWDGNWKQDCYNGYDWEDLKFEVTHWASLPETPKPIMDKSNPVISDKKKCLCPVNEIKCTCSYCNLAHECSKR